MPILHCSIHCQGGKDRTGVPSAVLTLAGVLIGRPDYGYTARNGPSLLRDLSIDVPEFSIIRDEEDDQRAFCSSPELMPILFYSLRTFYRKAKRCFR